MVVNSLKMAAAMIIMFASNLATATTTTASCPVPSKSGSDNSWNPPTKNVLEIPITEITMVVTRFEESLEPWIPVANRTYLYDKFGTPQSSDNVSHTSFLEYNVIPNVGHEQQTICYHVYNNYDRLSEVVLFAQAAPFASLLSPAVNTTMQMLEIAAKQPLDPMWEPAIVFNNDLITDLAQWGPVNWSSPEEAYWISARELKTLTLAPYEMGDYWSYLFGTPHPLALRVNHGGTFGATREALLRHPKDFYKRCLTAFETCGQNSSNDELGFFMERMDLAIVDEQKFSLPNLYLTQGRPDV